MVETFDEILDDLKIMMIPIDKCVFRVDGARQHDVSVKEDGNLVSSISRMGGIIYPVILQDLKNGQYEIIVGQRRVGAYRILKNEDSKYEKIRAYVIEQDLTDDEKKMLSWNENFYQKPMTLADNVNAIEHFYKKYASVTLTAKKLGVSIKTVRKYVRDARLPDKVKRCIENGKFKIKTALHALDAIGGEKNEVDADKLIELARLLEHSGPPGGCEYPSDPKNERNQWK